MEYSSYRLDQEEKDFIVFYHQLGFSYNDIIDEFYIQFKRIITKGAISKIISKYNATGNVENFKSPGRPEVYSERYKRELTRCACQEAEKSFRDREKDKILNPEGASKNTIQRTMDDYNIRSVVKSKRIDLMDQDSIQKRKKFALSHHIWTINDWKLLIFADEADILPIHSGKQYLKLRENQTIADLPIDKGWKQKKLTIKIWGAISYWGPLSIVRFEGTMKRDKYLRMLENHFEPILPSLQNTAKSEAGRGALLTLIDDNTSYHRVKDVINWKQKMGFYLH